MSEVEKTFAKKWLHKPGGESKIVETAKEEKEMLESGWFESPNDFPKDSPPVGATSETPEGGVEPTDSDSASVKETAKERKARLAAEKLAGKAPTGAAA